MSTSSQHNNTTAAKANDWSEIMAIFGVLDEARQQELADLATQLVAEAATA